MRAFEIVYEDAHIVVVDKAAGVLTVPTPRRERNTLVDQLSKAIRKRVIVVHRLDRDTSGLLVFAKDERTARALMDRWRDHERIYTAIVHGVMSKNEGTIESRLTTHSRSLDRRSSRRDDDEGEHAITHYRVVKRFKDTTHVELKLETGRRNQIRVHLAELGHAILGDERYAKHAKPHAQWRGGLALHAHRLSFAHPVTRAPMSFEAPLPSVFERFLRSM